MRSPKKKSNHEREMGKGIHGTWGLKLAQEAEDVGTHCDGCQARFRDRLCYSQYPGLSKGIRNLFLSGWVRDRGMSAILRYQVARLVLSNVWSAQPRPQMERTVLVGPQVKLLLPALTNRQPSASTATSLLKCMRPWDRQIRP